MPACAPGKAVPYKHLLDEAIRLASFPPEKVIVVDRGLDPSMPITAGRDLDYAALRERTPDRRSAGRLARVHRALVHPVYVRHHRQAQGRAARRRRLRGGAGRVDAAHLLR